MQSYLSSVSHVEELEKLIIETNTAISEETEPPNREGAPLHSEKQPCSHSHFHLHNESISSTSQKHPSQSAVSQSNSQRAPPATVGAAAGRAIASALSFHSTDSHQHTTLHNSRSNLHYQRPPSPLSPIPMVLVNNVSNSNLLRGHEDNPSEHVKLGHRKSRSQLCLDLYATSPHYFLHMSYFPLCALCPSLNTHADYCKTLYYFVVLSSQHAGSSHSRLFP